MKVKQSMLIAAITLAVLSIGPRNNVAADEEQSTYPCVSASYGGRYFFKMIPGAKDYYGHDSGSGVMCAINRDGSITELWRVSGWYAFQTFPSYDGDCLVRLGNWPRGRRPLGEHLAVAFYKKGELVKQYSTIDLIKDQSKVQSSVSHYQYQDRVPGFNGYTHTFTLVTVDLVQYDFDARTGAITAWKKLDR